MGERKVTQGLLPRIAIGVFGLMTVAMILLAVFDERGALVLRQRRQELDQLQIDIEKTHEENERIQKEIEGLRSDPRVIEKRAREQFKLVKPGEIMIDLTDMPPAPTPNP
jgi:cell division protein FtsB